MLSASRSAQYARAIAPYELKHIAMKVFAAALLLSVTAAQAAEVPPASFFSGNDIYDWCQHSRTMARSYTAGLFDSAAHAAAVIDDTRNFGKEMPKNDAQVDFALKRVVGYCAPQRVTIEQATDVFCGYLKDSPAKRDGLPAILFSDALTKAWPCIERN
jgi:Rap1a immunity proteins